MDRLRRRGGGSHRGLDRHGVGGAPGYTFAWEVSEPAIVPYPEAQTTTVISGDGATAILRCLVTDSLGQSAYSNTITVHL